MICIQDSTSIKLANGHHELEVSGRMERAQELLPRYTHKYHTLSVYDWLCTVQWI